MPRTSAGSVRTPAHGVPSPARSLPQLLGLVVRAGVLPGSGHLVAGHRRAGWSILLAFVVLGLGLVVALGITLFTPATVASLSVRPVWLHAAQWGIAAIAVVWALALLRGVALLRPTWFGAPGVVLTGLLTVALLAGIAVPAAIAARDLGLQRTFVETVFPDRPLPTGEPGAPVTTAASPFPRGRLNVLLVGSDAGEDRTGTRTDTVILASVDTGTGRTVLFTLPRNLENFPFTPGSVMAQQFPDGFDCGDVCLLNAVYDYAERNADLFPGDLNPGMTALRSGVSATLGLPIDYHIAIDLEGFEALVDALGGIDIDVERRLPIGGLDSKGNRIRPVGYIEAGPQHMNGDTALNYARSRSDSTDYERIRRQRCIIGAIQRQADPANILVNFEQVASSAADALVTDIPRSLLPDLVKLAFEIKGQPVSSLAFTPPDTLPDVTEPDIPVIQAAVQAALVAPLTSRTPSPTPTAALPGATPSPGTAPAVPADTPVSLASVCSYS